MVNSHNKFYSINLCQLYSPVLAVIQLLYSCIRPCKRENDQIWLSQKPARIRGFCMRVSYTNNSTTPRGPWGKQGARIRIRILSFFSTYALATLLLPPISQTMPYQGPVSVKQAQTSSRTARSTSTRSDSRPGPAYVFWNFSVIMT
jgi:hypothetical protein